MTAPSLSEGLDPPRTAMSFRDTLGHDGTGLKFFSKEWKSTRILQVWRVLQEFGFYIRMKPYILIV